MTIAGKLGFVLAGALAGSSLLPAHAANMPLASHRAVYDLSLLTSKGDNAPSSARGRIVFEFNGTACEGYAVSFRQVTEMQSSEGETMVSDMRSTTFEEGDGKGLNFKIETTNNGGRPEVIDGRATKMDGALSIDLRSPSREKLDLGVDVVFPTDQMVRLVEAAKSGARTVDMNVFDGSDTGKKIYATLTVIGREATNPPSEKPAQIDAMKNVRRWPVVVSFFDTSKTSDTPNYTLGFDLYENGISGALRLDYGQFVLKGEMSALDMLPSGSCDK
jgi:hypothetical protein